MPESFISKFAILTIVSLMWTSLASAQTSVSTSDVEQAKIIAEANLQQLESQTSNPNQGNDSFIFMLAVPSAMAATMDLVVMAGAAGYLSVQLQQDLQMKWNNINTSALSLEQIISELRWIFSTTNESIQSTQRNIEQLKAKGYSDSELINIAEMITTKNQMCTNRENNNSPENFCPDFIENFKSEGYQVTKKKGGWVVEMAGKFLCCLEWDNLHCGFEIFDKRGKHKGEVGCLLDELNPCQYNPSRGLHASPQLDHTPRSQACKR